MRVKSAGTRHASPYSGRRGVYGRREFLEEIVGELFRCAVDQTLAELGELAADLRLDIVAQHRAAVLWRQRHDRTALGEAGDAAIALAGNLVAVGRIEVRQRHFALKL